MSNNQIKYNTSYMYLDVFTFFKKIKHDVIFQEKHIFFVFLSFDFTLYTLKKKKNIHSSIYKLTLKINSYFLMFY